MAVVDPRELIQGWSECWLSLREAQPSVESQAEKHGPENPMGTALGGWSIVNAAAMVTGCWSDVEMPLGVERLQNGGAAIFQDAEKVQVLVSWPATDRRCQTAVAALARGLLSVEVTVSGAGTCLGAGSPQGGEAEAAFHQSSAATGVDCGRYAETALDEVIAHALETVLSKERMLRLATGDVERGLGGEATVQLGGG
jgi:hypothetical protein